MTQSLLAVEIAGPHSTKCPFDCGKTCNAANKFDREPYVKNKQSFGKNVADGLPSVQYRRTADGNYESDKTPNKDLAKYPPKNSPILSNEWGWAAHHLIPVSTLRDHGLRKYLDKDVSGTKVSCNVGYDVNGAPNGLWLIASYTGMQEEMRDPEIEPVIRSYMDRLGIEVKPGQSVYSALSANAKISNSEDLLEFKRWLFATMYIYKRQFHDSHSAYEDFVELVLNKIEAKVQKLQEECLDGSKCKDASKKPMAPHRIARRFDHISRRLSNYLIGHPSTWRKPIFTSTFAEMFADEVNSRS